MLNYFEETQKGAWFRTISQHWNVENSWKPFQTNLGSVAPAAVIADLATPEAKEASVLVSS